MEFLKAIFGDKYEEFASIIKAYNDNPENKDKQIKLADLNAGEYVSKNRHTERIRRCRCRRASGKSKTAHR